MDKIRVLIVDDSSLVRKLVTDMLSGEADIEVIGGAADGNIALQKISQMKPDIITLDVEMPELNGIETLKEIRKTTPKLPVIMFSALTERGASDTLDALAAGANDYITKPGKAGNGGNAKEAVQRALIEKIRALAVVSPQPIQKVAPLRTIVQPARFEQADVIAIGVSTGGPNALADLFTHFPREYSCPILITQHMPSIFTKMLADRISTKCGLPAQEGADGMKVMPGQIYIAPGDFHMEIVKMGESNLIRLNQNPPENSCRPAVDVMFRSVARVYGARTLAIILTGMGSDGKIGCEQIKKSGGRVVVQDEETSVVWGMPGAVAQAGLADAVLPLLEIKKELISRIGKKSSGATNYQNSLVKEHVR